MSPKINQSEFEKKTLGMKKKNGNTGKYFANEKILCCYFNHLRRNKCPLSMIKGQYEKG